MNIPSFSFQLNPAVIHIFNVDLIQLVNESFYPISLVQLLINSYIIEHQFYISFLPRQTNYFIQQLISNINSQPLSSKRQQIQFFYLNHDFEFHNIEHDPDISPRKPANLKHSNYIIICKQIQTDANVEALIIDLIEEKEEYKHLKIFHVILINN